MLNPEIKINMSVNAANLQRGLAEATMAVNKFGGVASGLKGLIASAFGGGTILLAIKSMIDFADETLKGAAALDTTAEKFQALKIMSRETGVEMDTITSAANKMGAAADQAVEGNAKRMAALHKLTITDKDIRDLTDLELLQKAMKAPLNRATMEATLREAGIKRPGELMPAQAGLANFDAFTAGKEKAGQIGSTDQLVQLQSLKFRFDSLVDSIKTKAVPVITWLITVIESAIMGFRMLGIGLGAIFSMISNTLLNIGYLIKNIFTEGPRKAFKEFAQTMSVDLSDAWNNTIKGENQKLIDARVKENDALNARLAALDKQSGPAGREAVSEAVPHFGAMKVGGLLGVDINTRLMHDTNQIVVNTKRMADNMDNLLKIVTGQGLTHWAGAPMFPPNV